MQIRPQEKKNSGSGDNQKRVTGIQLALLLLFGLGVFIAVVSALILKTSYDAFLR